MNTCLTFNGEKFSSDMELDSHLFNNFFGKVIKRNADLSYSVDLQQTTLDRLSEIESKVPKSKFRNSLVQFDEGEGEKEYGNDSCPGVTRFLNMVKNPRNENRPIIPPFNKEEFFENQKSKWRSEGKSESEIKSIIEKTEKLWEDLTNIGTDFHLLFEEVLKSINSNAPVDLNNWKKNVSREYDQELISYTIEDYRSFILDLFKKYPGCKIMTEVPIVSKHVHELLSAGGITGINGRIDLLVIDKDGIAHIYDLKVSRKPVDWNNSLNLSGYWHSLKKMAAEYQVMFYKAILEQYGIQCDIPKIISIQPKIEYTDNENLEIEKVSHFTAVSLIQDVHQCSNKYAGEAKLYIPETQTLTTNLDTVNTNLSKVFPGYQMTRKVQRGTVTVEYYRKKPGFVTEFSKSEMESNSSIKGQFKFYDSYRKRVIWCNDEEELNKQLEIYVEFANSRINSELEYIKTELKKALILGEDYNDDDLCGDVGQTNSKLGYCKSIFRKYYSKKGKWILEENSDLDAAGIFVFRQKGTNIIEIVSITNAPINEMVYLEKGTSVLGHTTADYNVDFHETYKSTNGNIDIIKVMAILNESSLMKEDSVINNISVHNIWDQQGIPTYPTHAFDNWKKICSKYKIDMKLNQNQFASVARSAMAYASDILNDTRNSKFYDWGITYTEDSVIKLSQEIRDKLNLLRNSKGNDGLLKALKDKEGKSWNFNDPYQHAYIILHQALLDLHGHKIYIEKDPEEWIKVSFGKGGEIYAGLNITAPGNSPSQNIQTLSKIFSIMEVHLKRKEMSYRPRYAEITRNLYEYNGRNLATGGEIKYYDNLFERDDSGNIKREFRLRDPKDPGLSKEESAFISMFLKIVNEFRYPSEKALAQAIENGSWRDVPIRRGSSKAHSHNNNLKEGIKLKYNEVVNSLRIFEEEQLEKLNEKRNRQEFYNKYRIGEDTREKLLDKYGPKYFETHLEDLLLDVIHSYCTEEAMDEYLPQMQGIKLTLMYNQGIYGQISDNVVQYIDKYLDINVYNQSIVKGGLQPIHKMISTIQRITTATTLGFNFRSGLRELLQGTWIHLSRTMAEAYGKDQFTKGEIAKAWGIVFKDMTKDVNMLTLVDAMNVEYGMANAGIDEIQRFLSQSKSGVKNFDSSTLFFANRIPDTFHRMGILIAKMLHDGCWEAHEIIDDRLVYNFKKDKRFSLLNQPGVDKTSQEYKHQHSLYETMRIQFNKEGFDVKPGEDLPRAYTVQEGKSVKAFSEMCFGHYDKNTQMLAKKMALGSAMLQFRTFLSAKLEQWSLKPGTYDQGQYEEKFNEEGIRYVRVISENEDGSPSVEIKLESELKGDEIWEPVIEWNGRFMEGILYSMASFGKKLLKLDWEGLRELWKVPVKRANFKLFLHDMVWMSILMAIMRALIMENDEVEMGPIEHFGATALYTSFADGPITAIMTSMFGDLNPPMYKIIKNYYNQLGGLVTGRNDFGDAMVGTFGALADLKYLNITD